MRDSRSIPILSYTWENGDQCVSMQSELHHRYLRIRVYEEPVAIAHRNLELIIEVRAALRTLCGVHFAGGREGTIDCTRYLLIK